MRLKPKERESFFLCLLGTEIGVEFIILLSFILVLCFFIKRRLEASPSIMHRQNEIRKTQPSHAHMCLLEFFCKKLDFGFYKNDHSSSTSKGVMVMHLSIY